MCGSSIIHEEGLCYSKGSQCEKWHKEGKSLRHIALEKSPKNEVSDVTYDSESKPGKMGQCGISETFQNRSKGLPWALRIIGGRESSRGKWPWQVAILKKNRDAYCGGTVVAPGWVLTAAHCAAEEPFSVRLGEHDLLVEEVKPFIF